MANIYQTAAGEYVDVDVLMIKQQIAQMPPIVVNVNAGKTFLDLEPEEPETPPVLPKATAKKTK